MIAKEVLEISSIPWCLTAWWPKTPPGLPYAILFDEVDLWGAPGIVLAKTHDVTIELYTASADHAAISTVASAFTSAGTECKQSETTYITSEKFYMTVFSYQEIVKVERGSNG